MMPIEWVSNVVALMPPPLQWKPPRSRPDSIQCRGKVGDCRCWCAAQKGSPFCGSHQPGFQARWREAYAKGLRKAREHGTFPAPPVSGFRRNRVRRSDSLHLTDYDCWHQIDRAPSFRVTCAVEVDATVSEMVDALDATYGGLRVWQVWHVWGT